MLTTIKTIISSPQSIIPLLDAEILLAHVLQKDRTYLLSHSDAPVSLWQTFRFKRLVKKRQRGVPVAYLTGHKEFFGLDFLVNKYTLVPRPETEVLVEQTIEEIKKLGNEEIILIDVGTGSGCIPITIVKTMEQWNNGTIKAYAIDISRGALKIAKKNAHIHDTDITFLQNDLLTPITNNFPPKADQPMAETMEQWNNGTIIITANLPYLTAEQFKEEPSIQHEPKSALVAADSGLALYKKLLKQVSQLFFVPCFLFLEIDPSQSAPLSAYIQNHFSNARVEIKKDLAGQDRVVQISF